MRLLALLAAGCGGPVEPPRPVQPPAPLVCAGDACVYADGPSATIRLATTWGLELVFPPDGVQIGVESERDDARSYDPSSPDDDTDWYGMSALALADGRDDTLLLTFTDGSTATLALSAGADGVIAARLVPVEQVDGAIVQYRLRPQVPVDERFYGLGETFDRPEHRGAVRPMQILYDPDLESGYNEVHVPVPLLVGTRGWGLLVRDDHPMVFDVAASAEDRVEVTVGTGMSSDAGLAFDLYAAADPLDVTARYWAATGAPRLPAPWALGPLLWRDENSGQAQLEADLDTIRELDLATTGVWVDRPYATGVNTFDFAAEAWPDPEAMIGRAHDLGFRMGVWHVPYVSAEQAPELNAEATAAGYFPSLVPIVFNSWGDPIDFTNPDAVGWWQSLLGNYETMGIEGYKLDYAEDVIVGLNGNRLRWAFHDGSDERTMHKNYTRLYHSTYADMLPEDGGFLLCRAGTWGDQVNASIIWPGDLVSDLSRHRDVREDGVQSVGGLPSAVSAAMGLGPSGFPFFASDTGGYRSAPPDRETLVRWFQHTALSAAMQVGNSASGQPWELLEGDDLALYADFARLHLRLFPYLWTYADALDGSGVVPSRPIVRPFGLAEPALGQHPDSVYFLGDNLLVAPVVDAGATTKRLPVPSGAWVSWWDGTPLEGQPGQEVEVSAPLDALPLYLRAGGIVPLLRPTIDTLSPVADPAAVDSFSTDAGVLWARVAVGDGTFTVYDGSALGVQDDGNVTLTWTAGSVFTQGAAWEVVGLGARPGTVTVDGSVVSEGDGWSWDGAVLTVERAGSEVVVAR